MADAEKKTETAVVKRAALPVALSVSGALAPANLQEAIEVAKLMAASGILPKQFDGNVGAVLVAIQMGAEVGLSPMAALQNIAVINGRPSLWGDAVLAIVVSHPDCLDVIEELDENTMTALCTVKRRGRQSITRKFSKQDAEVAGLWKKQGPWSQYPKRMLSMRARAFACRDAFPDALRGLRCAEEVRDYAPESIDVVDTLAAGDHSFGFRKQQEIAAPKPEVQHDPKTGEVAEPKKSKAKKEETPTNEPTPEEQAKWANVGPAPMDDNDAGARG